MAKREVNESTKVWIIQCPFSKTYYLKHVASTRRAALDSANEAGFMMPRPVRVKLLLPKATKPAAKKVKGGKR